MSTRGPRRSRDSRRRRISSSAEDEPSPPVSSPRVPKLSLSLRSLRSHDEGKESKVDEGGGGQVGDGGENADGLTRDKAEMWAEFAADHYEILEQLPLELHRNTRLIRELDQESLSQERKLEARIREYIAHRFALAAKPVETTVAEAEVETPGAGTSAGTGVDAARRPSPLEVKPTIVTPTPQPEPEPTRQPSDTPASAPPSAVEIKPSTSAPPKSASPRPAAPKSASPHLAAAAPGASILSPDSSKLSVTPAPASKSALGTATPPPAPLDRPVASPDRDERDRDADGSPDPDAVGSPDPEARQVGTAGARGSPEPDAAGSPDPDAAGSPDPSVQNNVAADPSIEESQAAPSLAKPISSIGLGPAPSLEPVPMSRQSSSSEVGAVDDAIAIDDDDVLETPDATPARRPVSASLSAPEATPAQPPVAAASAPAAESASALPTKRGDASTSADTKIVPSSRGNTDATPNSNPTPTATATTTSKPRAAGPNPSTLALADIQRLARELVRNKEEMVAVAIGAYNAVDRHIRALDSMLEKQGSLGLLTAEATPVVEEPVPGRPGRKKQRTEPAPPVIPPNLEIDPNEPRYCYCNQVSFGEMVGCDNEDCPYEWFHLTCLGMTAAPVGNWLCDACKPGGSGETERPRGPKRKRR